MYYNILILALSLQFISLLVINIVLFVIIEFEQVINIINKHLFVFFY